MFGAEPETPMSLYGRQPGLTYRRTCPSIPGLGAGGTPPKNDASWTGLSALFQKFRYSRYSRDSRTMLQSRRDYTCTVECLSPHIPRLPQINFIVGGVYGVKNRYILFCLLGRCLSPLTLVCALSMCLGLGGLHPLIFCRLASPYNLLVVWFIYNYLLKSCI